MTTDQLPNIILDFRPKDMMNPGLKRAHRLVDPHRLTGTGETSDQAREQVLRKIEQHNKVEELLQAFAKLGNHRKKSSK